MISKMRRITSTVHLIIFFFALTNIVYGADESFIDQFLGSPLLILAAAIVVDVFAFAFHKMRR